MVGVFNGVSNLVTKQAVRTVKYDFDQNYRVLLLFAYVSNCR